MSAASPNTIAEMQCEALKALADWSKWLISLESALIVARVAMDNDNFHGIAVAALFCFLSSILIAAWLLGSVPAAMEQIPILDKGKPNIYVYRQFESTLPISIPIWVFAFFEHLFFAVGLILFVLSFI